MANRDQFSVYDSKLQECSFSYQQAKQIATIKWLVHKAYDNDVHNDLKEPFYCDKRPQQQSQSLSVIGKSLSIHLKPAVVYLLANAELYCLALVNIYLDPNYHNLNHTGIIQALARKGVMLSDPHLTETVLLQTSPLKLAAHMCVMEALMTLYVKEIATQDRIYAAIRKFNSFQQQRFNQSTNNNSVIQNYSVSDYDQLLLLWISEAVSALNKKIKQQLLSELQVNNSNVPSVEKNTEEYFKSCHSDLLDLTDGIALCALVSFYCPQSLSWKSIRVNQPITNTDCLHNLNLFYNFCQHCLPYPIFHMMPQDMTSHSMSYMKSNWLVLLTDLFNVLEINPVNCVLLGNHNGVTSELTFMNSESQINSNQNESAYTRKIGLNVVQKRPLTASHQMPIIPNLRNYSTASNSSNSADCRTANSSPKVDRKFRNNISDNQSNSEVFVVHKGRNIPTLSSICTDSNHKDKSSETVAAGKPTNWNDTRKNQISGFGRRSRRNSFSDESQLTLENFGGSQENINLLSRNPDKEPAVHIANLNTDDYNDNNGKQYKCHVAAQENRSSAAITNLLREDDSARFSASRQSYSHFVNSSNANTIVTNFSEVENGRNCLANATTASPSTVPRTAPSTETAEMLESCKVNSQMINIRLKLEEKRKQIEMEKKRMELNLKKQRQKLSKAAFLQAVSKIDNNNDNKISENDKNRNVNVGNKDDSLVSGDSGAGDGDLIGDGISIKNINRNEIIVCNSVEQDISQVEQRWLKKGDEEINSSKGDGLTPDADALDIEKYQKSISEMDSSLHAIQTDLQWLAAKENEILQGPVIPNSVHSNVVTADAQKSSSISFVLNQDHPGISSHQQMTQNQMYHKITINNGNISHNNTDFTMNASGSDNFPSMPDNYNSYSQQNHQQHYSMLPTVGSMDVKSPLSPPCNPIVIPPQQQYDNINNTSNNANNYYPYQMQSQVRIHPHATTTNFSNYHSINVIDNNTHNNNITGNNVNVYRSNSVISDSNKENQHYAHQYRGNEQQFYLHSKPYENSPFHLSSSPSQPLSNMNISTTSTPANHSTNAYTKTWENKNSSANASPQHTSHLFSPTRYTPPGKESMTFSKTFLDSKNKAITPISRLLDDYHNTSLRNENSSGWTETLPFTKKNFPLSHVDRAVNSDLNYHNRFNVSETDRTVRNSSSNDSISVPTPSADDMEPQCISFIGSQSNIVRKYDNKQNENFDAQITENVNKLHISSGNRTYRIPSPTTSKPHQSNHIHPFLNDDSNKNEKGFYVPFTNDDDTDKVDGARFSERNAAKFPLRVKKFANSINSAFVARNDKDSKTRTNSNVKTKPEFPKKPEVIPNYNNTDKDTFPRYDQRRFSNDDCVEVDNRITEKSSNDTILIKSKKSGLVSNSSVGLIINPDSNTNDPAVVDEMEKKKERILLQSLQRRQQQEESKAQKEIELQRKKEQEKLKEEIKAKKKEEEKHRRAIILQRHRLKKAVEEAEREGKVVDKEILQAAMMNTNLKLTTMNGEDHNTPVPKLRSRNQQFASRPRPKTIHIDVASNTKVTPNENNLINLNYAKKGSTVNLTEHNNNYPMSRRDYYRGSQDCLLAGPEIGNTAGTSASSIYSDMADEDRVAATSYTVNGSACGSVNRRRGSSHLVKPSRDVSLDRGTSRIARPKFSSYYQSYPRKSSSLMNLCGSSCDKDSFTYNSRFINDTDSPPHRTCSPAPNNASPSGPGSLPSSHHNRRLRYDDTASEGGGSEYCGLRLYKQPVVKSNRGIIMNALEYCVFPGEVNRDQKNVIIQEINKADASSTRHFLILFRDARYQFRALYSYLPENEEVTRLYGKGPKQITDKMFDKFYKYNSGGKNFNQVHTKHLTVTIDAFTIHNSIWQGKKPNNLPSKRDMALVI